VFFWPGTADGPIAYGVRHFGRYAPEQPAILRIPTGSLIAANPDIELRFSRCNSGSPRWSRGIPGKRGDNTFQSSDAFSLGPTRVVEVTVRGSVVLPQDTSRGPHPAGPWTPLFQGAPLT
jgi:hypothetical protein